MKQIFDWLRKEAREEIMPKGSVSKTEMLIKSSCYGKVLALIDEAEAKREAEVCEYEYHVATSKDIYYLTSCKRRHNARLWNDEPYCRYCGKPIKISEVE